MNPLDLPGPQFLSLYIVLFLLAGAAAIALRWYLSLPGGEPHPSELKLEPEEIACLQGGEEAVVTTTVARLIHEHALAFDAQNKLLQASVEPPARFASPLTQAAYMAVKDGTGISLASMRSALAEQVKAITRQLENAGLLLGGERAWLARFAPALLPLLVLLLGIMKIFVGLSRDRPVVFLVMLCIVSAFMLFALVSAKLHRSRRGDRALKLLQKANAALQYQMGSNAKNLAGSDLALAVGLFGMGVLAASPLDTFYSALKAEAAKHRADGSWWSNSCSSGCGSSCGSSCGGGCGGGGCGGCGS